MVNPNHKNINHQPKSLITTRLFVQSDRDCHNVRHHHHIYIVNNHPYHKNINHATTRLFVQSDRDCRQFCEDTADCRFYYWSPIYFLSDKELLEYIL